MDWLSLLRCYAESLGLRLDQHVDFYQWLIPFLYQNLPTLVLNPDEMEFPLRKPSGINYVGPMICTDRAKLPFLPKAGKPLLKLEELLDEYRNGRSDKRLIYCSFGTYFSGDDNQFLKKLAMSFKDTDWNVIIALGNRLDPAKLGNLPDNVLCLTFAPQMEILSVSDCAVIHGGMTTVYECIHYAVPMVVYPFKVNDQLGTSSRVLYHGLGLVGRRRKDSTSKIRDRITKVMGDRLIKNNLERMRQNFSRYTDGTIAAETVYEIIMGYSDSS
jgi:MGT family glycosyltransferase